jgi:hypothetical protein
VRKRLVLTAAAFSAFALAAPGALASSTPVLDGKKVTKLTLAASGGLQDHDDDNTQLLASVDRANCAPPRCAVLKFVYKPAKGVQGDTLYTIKWTNPASDMDLYVAAVDKKGEMSEVGATHCGGGAGTSEKVFVPAGTLKSGKTYALVADFFRSVNDNVTGTVEMPASDFARPVPAQADGALYPINCTL